MLFFVIIIDVEVSMDGSLSGGDAYEDFVSITSQNKKGEKFVCLSGANANDCVRNISASIK